MKTSDSPATLPRAAPALEPEIEHEQWLAAIAKGDERALGRFYDATVRRVFGLALRIVRQREAAEEVVEVVYMQVWPQAGRFDVSRGRPLPWLLTICRSWALDFFRRDDKAMAHPAPETLVTDQEIAGHTQFPLGTIKSHLRKVLEKMREQLGDGKGVLFRFQPGARFKFTPIRR